MKRTKLIAILAALAPAAAASAAVLSTEFPIYEIEPGQSKVVNIYVSDGGWIQGVDVTLIIGDGGPDLGGVDTTPPAPFFVGGMTFQNGIFAGNTTGDTEVTPNGGLYIGYSTTTVSGEVLANGLLTSVEIAFTADTPLGTTYQLAFFGEGATGILGPNANPLTEILGATIVAVPEPAAGLLLLAGLPLLRRRRA